MLHVQLISPVPVLIYSPSIIDEKAYKLWPDAHWTQAGGGGEG
jgi:hypothetical protein